MVSLDEIFNKARDVANLASKKTGEVVEVSKLKLKAVQVNADIQKAYEKLGSIVYEQDKTDSKSEDLIALSISEIDLLFAELSDVNDKISQSKSTIKCHNCGAVNSEESMYCSRCGSTLIVSSKKEDTVYTNCETVDTDSETEETENKD